ncbi:hypothetical protein NEHOM01_1616 [Nematocida homosporus]|uniref:uncharacterized protein n=1 Tax=Nematocida homosporus TaxID=1912981 RepID=UPI0022206D4B|nr:uncharacterized protein NEHOM01_1616 [Nematocida homosporus]KAI5186663.1 hypothetical protein NEHOM01_1616 [Nematocida homosporus]
MHLVALVWYWGLAYAQLGLLDQLPVKQVSLTGLKIPQPNLKVGTRSVAARNLDNHPDLERTFARFKEILFVTVPGLGPELSSLVKTAQETNPLTPVLTYLPDLSKLLRRPSKVEKYEKVLGVPAVIKQRLLSTAYPAWFSVQSAQPEPGDLNLTLKNMVLLRGLCLLSNYVIVNDYKQQDLITSFFGVPTRKIIVAQGERKVGPEVVLNELENTGKFKVPNGLYVLFSCSTMHINVQVTKHAITKIYLRSIYERPLHDRLVVKRGAYNRIMDEVFIEISKNQVRLDTELPNVIRYKNKQLSLFAIGVTAIVNIKTMKISLVFISETRHGAGLIVPSSSSLIKWRLAADDNPFAVNHPLLKVSIDGKSAFLYNRPRRNLAEPFEFLANPVQRNPLCRVNVDADFTLSGFGLASKHFVRNILPDQRFFVTCRPVEPGCQIDENFTARLIHYYLLEVPARDILAVVSQPKLFQTKGIDLRNSFPINLQPTRLGHRLLIHFPWEFSIIPSIWINPLLQKKKYTIVSPSIFTKRIHAKNGIPKERIHVVPHGVSYYTMQIEQKIRRRQRKYGIAQLFHAPKHYTRFVCINGAMARKGLDLVVRAFTKAFTHKDNVVLRLHCAYGDPPIFNTIHRLLWENQRAKGPLIIYTRNYLSQDTIRAMLSASHYNVSPYRAEGFGLSILEGIALGSIPITTKCQPATEFCSSQCTFFIPSKKTQGRSYPVITHPNGRITMFDCPINSYPRWNSPDLDALVQLLREAHQLRQKDLPAYQKMRAECFKCAKAKTWALELTKLKKVFFKLTRPAHTQSKS